MGSDNSHSHQTAHSFTGAPQKTVKMEWTKVDTDVNPLVKSNAMPKQEKTGNGRRRQPRQPREDRRGVDSDSRTVSRRPTVATLGQGTLKEPTIGNLRPCVIQMQTCGKDEYIASGNASANKNGSTCGVCDEARQTKGRIHLCSLDC